MKTRSSDDALPLPATASGGRRASSGGGGGLVGAWHRHCKSCACAVQSWGCSVADCCRACLPPPPRPAGPAPPRTSNGMRIVLVVLLLVRAAAPPIPARASEFPRLRARPAPPPNPLPALTTARPRLSDFPVQSRASVGLPAAEEWRRCHRQHRARRRRSAPPAPRAPRRAARGARARAHELAEPVDGRRRRGEGRAAARHARRPPRVPRARRREPARRCDRLQILVRVEFNQTHILPHGVY